jgi:hypothetical protein
MSLRPSTTSPRRTTRESAPLEVGGGQVAVDVDACSISTVVIDL